MLAQGAASAKTSAIERPGTCLKKGDAMLRVACFELDAAEPHERVHHLALDRKHGQPR